VNATASGFPRLQPVPFTAHGSLQMLWLCLRSSHDSFQLLQHGAFPVVPWPYNFPLSLWLIVQGLSARHIVAISFERMANAMSFLRITDFPIQHGYLRFRQSLAQHKYYNEIF